MVFGEIRFPQFNICALSMQLDNVRVKICTYDDPLFGTPPTTIVVDPEVMAP